MGNMRESDHNLCLEGGYIKRGGWLCVGSGIV